MPGIEPVRVRILHVMDSLANGGLENGVVNLINHLDPEQFEHSVCTVRAQGVSAARLPADRVRLVHIGKRKGSRFQVTDLRRVIRDLKPDVVHSRNWGGIEAVIAARFAGGCRIVHSEHGLETSDGAREPWRRVVFRRLAFEIADRVLCVSHKLRDLHARRTGFPPRRITVIHNGVDTCRFRPDPDARVRLRRELDLDENAFCIGCVANLWPVKDHSTLLRAVDRSGGAARSWHLLIAGEGPERPRLEALANRVAERGVRVWFTGACDRVPELLNAFDAYVLPSINEGLSNSLLEAMATGLPVIACDVGGNPEVVEDGVSGLLFPPGDADRLADCLDMLYARAHAREEFGCRARRRVQEEFSIDAMVRSYERLYLDVSQRLIPVEVEAGA